MWHETKVIGNVGRDPEMRYLPSGSPVTSFSVAANNTYTAASGEKVKETTWYKVSAFGKLAETVNQYVKKGMLVLVIGQLKPDKQTGRPRIWQSNDGTSKADYELTAQTVKFLSRVETPDVGDMLPPEDEF